jgi:hypothetical protein
MPFTHVIMFYWSKLKCSCFVLRQKLYGDIILNKREKNNIKITIICRHKYNYFELMHVKINIKNIGL